MTAPTRPTTRHTTRKRTHKLSIEQKLEARSHYYDIPDPKDRPTIYALAYRYNVSYTTMWMILNRPIDLIQGKVP